MSFAQVTQNQRKTLPYSAQAEHAILGAMIINNEIQSECLTLLTPDHFFVPANRKIFVAIQGLFNEGKLVDAISILDKLKSNRELHDSDKEYVYDLSTDVTGMLGWMQHIDILKRDATLRNLIYGSQEIASVAYDEAVDVKEAVDKAESIILNITNKSIGNNQVTLATAVQDLYTHLGELAENKGDILGIQTGYKRIDRNLLGLRPGQMIVIGARPAVGKTAFALNLAINAAVEGASVAFFSLEMSSTEIAQRLLSSHSGVDMQAIRSANIKNDQWSALLRATEELSALDIQIDDTPGTTITEIRAKARRMLHEKKKGIIIVDYLQLVSPPSGHRADSRATEVSEMSRGIKIMAKDLGVPVVALSQLNRSSKQRGFENSTPQLSDLRESGSIEQDADIVILLDRSASEEEASKKGRPEYGITKFIIAKNRSGPVDTIDLHFVAGKTKFLEVDLHHSE